MFQYFHQMTDKRFTVCLEVPDKDILLNFTQLDFAKDIALTYGIVFVHDNDFYSRKTGRYHSERRMIRSKFTLVSVDFIEDYALLYLYNPQITITIRLHKHGQKAHFVHAELTDEG